jgi:hypothetical protein
MAGDADGVSPDASGNMGVSEGDGLPEEIKALFAAQASPSTTLLELGEDKPRERDNNVAVDENKSADPNYTSLKLTLALEDRVERHMKRLEAGLVLGEVMAVLKTVRTSPIND